MGISTHVLDTARGRPAAGIAVRLERHDDDWREVHAATTDADGRVGDLLAGQELAAGRYRVTFATGDYHRDLGEPAFHPQVTVEFTVTAPDEHHHVPLLLSPFGYTTYRGS